MEATTIQTAFSAGELAPSVSARVDIEKYAIGALTLLNFIVMPHGGVTRRPGLRYIYSARYRNKRFRLVPFSFNTLQTYALEFGDQYMRVYKDGGVVVEDAKVITAATKANPCQITSAAHGYTNGQEVYIADIVGMTQLNGRFFKVAGVTTDTFTLTDLDGTAINSTAYSTYVSGGTVARVYEIGTPYTEADLPDLDYCQQYDVMTLCHPSYDPRELSRLDHDSWQLSVIVFAPQQARPTNLSGAAGGAGSTVFSYKVTAINKDNEEESLPALKAAVAITGATQAFPCVITSNSHGLTTNDDVWIDGVVGMTQLNGKSYAVNVLTANTYELIGIDATAYTAYSSGGNGYAENVRYTGTTPSEGSPNTITFSTVSTAIRYAVYKRKNGVYGFIGFANTGTFSDTNIAPETGDTPPRSDNPFVGDGNFPSTAAYYKQRRAFANTDAEPQTVWMTQAGRYKNMAKSSPLKDDDAIKFALLANEVNSIRYLVPLKKLIALTSGGEWVIQGSGGEPLLASNPDAEPESYRGSAKVKPIIVGNTILFVQEVGSIVRDLSYEFASDGYSGQELSLLSNHLFEGKTIVEWCYQQAPHSVIWCVLSDGTFLSLTYVKEQRVWAWSRHETRGEAETVCCIREHNEYAVYLGTRRIVQGMERRFVERMNAVYFADIRDAFFLDCGLTYDLPMSIEAITADDPCQITITGHGLTDGDLVDIADIKDFVAPKDFEGEITDLNGLRFEADVLTANTFTLKNRITGDPISTDGWNIRYTRGGTVRKVITTARGLEHLNGEEIAALSDGSVVGMEDRFGMETDVPYGSVNGDLVPEAGSLTMEDGFSRLHVGFPYKSDLETLDIEIPPTIQGKEKRVIDVTFRVDRTREFLCGTKFDDNMEVFSLRDDEVDYGEPSVPATGDINVPLDSAWDTQGRVCVRQWFPVPTTILAAIPHIDVTS